MGSLVWWDTYCGFSRLEPNVYAPLSYFGVIMVYVYGILINGEHIKITKVLGSRCISNTHLSLLIISKPINTFTGGGDVIFKGLNSGV
jgi:hypothetical protein